MTFVLGADATAGVLEETRHKGEGRRVAKGDRDREVPRGSVPGSLGCGGRCGVPPSSCLREVAPRGAEQRRGGGPTRRPGGAETPLLPGAPHRPARGEGGWPRALRSPFPLRPPRADGFRDFRGGSGGGRPGVEELGPAVAPPRCQGFATSN
ncbi:unnamed protein product [Rangifer tarandus platyrhynchus]|uniref:Uncharacterized protein n=2 Tax=Rangifer tarandus platyrhynchus TaxID=3082113 RepID=A0ACB0EYR8_RANTA|nr:unnamed protein product [Rangifer tarandus platyrhynchus]CAI9705806.1 unnamed protein product [Rangifer tarandus platyrhynchus]